MILNNLTQCKIMDFFCFDYTVCYNPESPYSLDSPDSHKRYDSCGTLVIPDCTASSNRNDSSNSSDSPDITLKALKAIRDIASLCINVSRKTVQLSPPILGKFCEKLIFCVPLNN